MSIPLSINNVIYTYPEQGDLDWGANATLWASAVTTGMLQKAGGSFALTADVDFGTAFGLIAPYFSSSSDDISETGNVRLARTDSIGWRNDDNLNDLLLSVNNINLLEFDGFRVFTEATNTITNDNIASNASIAWSKMANLIANRAVVTDGSTVITVSATTADEIGYISGLLSNAQDQIDAKISASGGTMTGALLLPAIPTLALEAVNKQYVDNAALIGFKIKDPVVAATLVNGTLATDFENGDTIDGVVLATNDRILIKDQTDDEDNGIYIVQASGAPVRSSDASTWDSLVQAYTFVEGGTQAGFSYVCNIQPGGTLGTDPVIFTLFSAATVYTTDGEGIELSGNVFSLELDGSTLSKSASGLRLAAAQVTTINNKMNNVLTTTGDMVFSSSGSTPNRLGIGTSGQVLTVQTGQPTWVTPVTNPTVVGGSTGATLAVSDSGKVYLVNTASARTFNLPTPTAGVNFTFKDISGLCATNNISLVRNASEQIEGISATKLLQTNYGTWKLIADGTNWWIVT